MTITKPTNQDLLKGAGKCKHFIFDSGAIECKYKCKKRGRLIDPINCVKNCASFEEIKDE